MTKQVSRFVIEGNPCVIELEVKPAQLIGHGRTVDLEPIPADAVELSICGTLDGSSGQCVADIRAATDDADVTRLCELWERWHLNGMRAGCRIQNVWLAANMPSGDYEARKAALVAAGWEPAEVEAHPAGESPSDKRGSHFTSYSYGSAWLFEPVPPAVIEELRALLKSLSGRRIGPAPDVDDLPELDGDIFDSRDAIKRIEGYREAVTAYGLDADTCTPDDVPDNNPQADDMREVVEEWCALRALEADASGCSNWLYGEGFIADHYFEEYAQELAEDIGAVKKDSMSWPANHIDWEAAADALKQDYSAFEYRGETYWARS